MSDEAGLVIDVNETFLAWTGYSRQDMVGQRRFRDLLTVGGRILYETHLGPHLAVQGRISEVAVDLRCADGTDLPVLLNARTSGREPSSTGQLRFALLTFGERRNYERDLQESRRAAEAAVGAWERAQRRLNLAAEVNLVLSGTLDIDVARRRLVTMLATERGGYCGIIVFADDRRNVAVEVAPNDDRYGAALEAMLTDAARSASERSLSRVRTGDVEVPILSRQPYLRDRLEIRDPDAPAGETSAFGPSLIVPIRARNQHIAAIVLTRPAGATPYVVDDLSELADLSDRIGLFIDNLNLYAAEHDRALALQQALLTPPAHGDGLEVCTRYLPNAAGATVGGDWYDSFVRPDGSTVIVVGDVSGHDHVAAAGMGQLRGLLRAIAYTGSGMPSEILADTDAAAVGLGVQSLATVFVARIGSADSATGARAVTWASAGHLPAAVVTDGQANLLNAAPDLLLGVQPEYARRDHHLQWPAGSTIVLYTDGLVEDAARSLDTGLDDLVAALAATGDVSLDQLCDSVIERVSPHQLNDDVALLAIRNATIE